MGWSKYSEDNYEILTDRMYMRNEVKYSQCLNTAEYPNKVADRLKTMSQAASANSLNYKK